MCLQLVTADFAPSYFPVTLTPKCRLQKVFTYEQNMSTYLNFNESLLIPLEATGIIVKPIYHLTSQAQIYSFKLGLFFSEQISNLTLDLPRPSSSTL